MNELAQLALALRVSVLDLLLPPDDGTLVRVVPHGSVHTRNGLALDLFHFPPETLTPAAIQHLEERMDALYELMAKVMGADRRRIESACQVVEFRPGGITAVPAAFEPNKAKLEERDIDMSAQAPAPTPGIEGSPNTFNSISVRSTQ